MSAIPGKSGVNQEPRLEIQVLVAKIRVAATSIDALAGGLLTAQSVASLRHVADALIQREATLNKLVDGEF